ncbi:Melanopsin [Holothuria leucospilota]|uniref:Melanopsin n=1 Tax=Holothuria leucospilota TaxID=206669 RepID=A0A9Q0YIA0_HOLLE|nr:Melanopsin [Holothuria leucospilota]
MIVAAICSTILHTTTNVLIINLAVADVIMNFLALVYLSILFTRSGNIAVTCAVMFVGVETLYGCSLYTLTSISVHRCLVVTKPRPVHPSIPKRKFVTVWIVAIWAWSFAIAMSVHSVTVRFYNDATCQCDITSSPKLDDLHILHASALMLLYVVPICVIVGGYFRIYVHIRRHNRRLKNKFQTEMRPVTSCNPPDATNR